MLWLINYFLLKLKLQPEEFGTARACYWAKNSYPNICLSCILIESRCCLTFELRNQDYKRNGLETECLHLFL